MTDGSAAQRPCDSCGRTGEVVAEVRRVYLTTADWDREEQVDVVDEPEWWCDVCREHYPHVLPAG